MAYLVHELFLSLQGEGVNAGRAAVFCRFAGCNLWSGREEDRATAACTFCDTEFRGTDGPDGGRFDDPDALAGAVRARWPADDPGPRLAVCTGGEPALQLDAALVAALHARGFRVAIETNGTLPLPPGLDWVCVSPKAGAPIQVARGDELKLVFPQAGLDPATFLDLDFRHFVLQPMDGPDLDANTSEALRYCREHPRWRLGIQLHKVWGIR